MGFVLDPQWHMWVIIATTVVVLIAFAWEPVSLELTSLALVAFLLVWFQVCPLADPGGGPNRLDPKTLLAGFANPSLLAVLALLVMGQAMVQTGALTGLTRFFVGLSKERQWLAVGLAFAGALVTSSTLNNTPVVVMFIPIMQTLATRLGWSPSRLMMPLSFAAILGGMTTMIGSSTNMLVASALTDLGLGTLEIFDVTALGVVMAAAGSVYVVLVLPRLLPHRGGLAGTLLSAGKQFIAEIDVTPHAPLVGQTAVSGLFKALPEVTVRLVQRGGQNFYPPFEDVELQPGDILIVAATRQALTDALARNAGYLLTQTTDEAARQTDGTARRPAERVLTEVMIAPASRMIDQSVDAVGFQRRFGCLVLGIQRRGRMTRQRLGEIRLEAGDVLLLMGGRNNVDALANNPDLVLMAWATHSVPMLDRAPYAAAIFATTVAFAAVGLAPISVAAVSGAVAMLLFGCLNIRQAARAMDRTIFLLVGASLGLGIALYETGAADFLGRAMIDNLSGPNPATNLSVVFLTVALATNVLSNNACAVLFTPIAVSMAGGLGLPPSVMAITVILAANCSFATPIGYQTNLLVMGPGHYRFSDFLRGGAPLILLMWVVFSLIAPIYFGL